ncbi:MAG: hypothetical protein AAF696_03590 [Bacteroidota bacterium]
MKPLIQNLKRVFGGVAEFFLGNTHDIPVFEDRPATPINVKLESLQKEYPERGDIQGFCREIEEMLDHLAERRTIEAGAFLNFCDRVFDQGIDIYTIESMLWEVNHPPEKGTINRQAHELSQFYQRLERRIAAFMPKYYHKKEVKSMMEELSELKRKDTSVDTQAFCRDALQLIPELNNNEQIPAAKLRKFMQRHAPYSSHYFEMEILLGAPDPKDVRVLDAFPRIFFVRKLLENLIANWPPKSERFKEAEKLEARPATFPDPILSQEKLENLRLLIGKSQENDALKALIQLFAGRAHLQEEALRLQDCRKKLLREELLGQSSRTRISKLRWLRFSWFLNLVDRLEQEAGLLETKPAAE